MFTLNSQYPLTSQNTSVRSDISYPTPPAMRPPTPVGPVETSVAPRRANQRASSGHVIVCVITSTHALP